MATGGKIVQEAGEVGAVEIAVRVEWGRRERTRLHVVEHEDGGGKGDHRSG
jgi:hypothetical protein